MQVISLVSIFVESFQIDTKVEIDFSGQFIDNRSKGSIFGGGMGLRLPS
jgi:hypothetical protein